MNKSSNYNFVGTGENRAKPAVRPTGIMMTTCDGTDEENDEPLSPSAVGDDPGMKVLLEVKSPDITPGRYIRLKYFNCQWKIMMV